MSYRMAIAFDFGTLRSAEIVSLLVHGVAPITDVSRRCIPPPEASALDSEMPKSALIICSLLRSPQSCSTPVPCRQAL
jgi:hypothetical protein